MRIVLGLLLTLAVAAGCGGHSPAYTLGQNTRATFPTPPTEDDCSKSGWRQVGPAPSVASSDYDRWMSAYSDFMDGCQNG